jgi:predicted acyl esterase
MRTDVADTDLAVRLCDVYPDGRSMLVCDGIFRLRFMNGFQETDEIALVPGQDYVVGIDLPNTAITFLAGHQIRVDITGSNYPDSTET